MPKQKSRAAKELVNLADLTPQAPGGRRWPRQLSRESEARILEAAYDVFRERGFSAATIGEIAEAAAISKATLYRRFENKQALFESVVYKSLELAAGVFDDIELDLDRPEASLRRYAMVIREVNELPRYREIFRMVLAEAPRQPELAVVWRQAMIDEILQRLVDYFQRLAKLGRMNHPWPDLASRNFLVTFAGSFRGLFGVELSEKEREQIFEMDLETFIRGCDIKT